MHLRILEVRFKARRTGVSNAFFAFHLLSSGGPLDASRPGSFIKRAGICRQHQSALPPMTFSALSKAQNSSFMRRLWG